ncbi:MAG: hypothetical protein B7X06_03595, partial [Verrucomicrobia bacterium 21-51-4]
PLVTQGQARNAVLAILAAWHLGVPEPLIAQRMADWGVSEHRGELYNEDARWFYADCYNANPASMSDALDQFSQIMPKQWPRLYILGSMRELGDAASASHAEVGAQLNLREQDHVIFVGEHAQDYWQGFTQAGYSSDQATLLASTAAVRPHLEQFAQGVVFLKASKGFKFWELIPSGAQRSDLAKFVKN